jgi:hypothetical protein
MLCIAVLTLGPYVHAESPRSYFQNCQSNTGTNATVVLTESTGLYLLNRPGHLDVLQSGDEIAAFTPEGLCVGKRVWSGETMAFTMWADDPLTPAKDGYAPGDPVIFRAWNVSRRTELSSIYVQYRDGFNTSGRFATDGIYLPRIVYFYPSDGMGSAREALAAARSAEKSSTAEAASRSASHPAVPDAFALDANFPNPFRTTTTIRYGLPEPASVRLDVYDALGRRVATLVSEEQQPAWHEVEFHADDLTPGVYIYRLRAGDFVSQRQLTFVR